MMKYIQKILAVFLFGVLFMHTSHAVNAGQLKDHPRLFLDNQRIEALKRQTDEVSLQLKGIICRHADEAVLLSPVVYPKTGFKMWEMRETQRRVLCLSMSYLLTGEEKYLSAAKGVLARLSALDDWGLNHFLDVGEAALAAGIGLDWLYDKLSAEEKNAITRSIVKNALQPALLQKESKDSNSWVNGNFNWNPVCHGGTMTGALAIMETEPQLARLIIDRAVKNIPLYSAAFEPDGSDAEGPSYWSYGASFFVIATEVLRTATGSVGGLDQCRGFLKSGDYHNQVMGVTGEHFNYSDYHVEKNNEPIMLWFGRELNRYDLVEKELRDINELHQQLTSGTGNQQELKKVFPNRHIPLELLWWDPSLPQKAKSAAPLHWTAKGGLPLGITRSSWTDTRASLIAIKGGTPNNSHAHMDVGGFILEANGVRWALDLGTESYDKMRAAKLDLWNYSQNSDRWTTFRVGPEGHNILRFDGTYQQIQGEGTIQSLTAADGSAGHQLDLSALYTGKAARVQRSVWLHPDGTMSIRDEWAGTDRQTLVSWQWLTKAEVTRTAKGLTLRQNGETLHITIESPALSGLQIEVEDVSVPRSIQDSPNPGLKRIVVKLPTGNTSGKLLVKAIPG